MILAVGFSLCPINLLAQSPTTGAIAGTVKDENGAVIVGAAVTVTNDETGEERKATSDTEGNYVMQFLPAGKYQIRVKAIGFLIAVSNTQVAITETRRVDVEMKLPGVDTVTVNIDSLLQTDGPQMGRVVDSRAVRELPLATRNFMQMLALSPGTSVALPDNTSLGRNSQNVSVNGARISQNNFELNGVDANKLDTNSAYSLPVPAPETIQEFKVQTSLYDATFGRGAGGSLQVVTRSGENNFHGASYEYFRNEALNANNPFLKAAAVKRPVLQRNVFGGLLGGPIKTNRMFFFGSYQGTRERNGASRNSRTSSVMVAQGLTDDRSAQKLLETFKPVRNEVPALSIHPVALALLNAKLPNGQFLIPTPQADGHYSGSAISTYREDQLNANLDYRWTEQNSLALKVFFSRAPQFLALPGGLTNVPGIGADREQDNRVIAFQDIHRLSGRTANEVRAGYNFIRQDTFGRNPIRDSDLGIKRANAAAFPGLGRITIGNLNSNAVTIGNSGLAIDIQTHESATTFVDIISMSRGRHTLRIGGEVIDYRVHLTTNNNRRGQITFGSFNNFLIGSATNSTYGDGINTRNLRATDYSGFVQDDWKFSRKLTINLGLRYELDLPPYDTRGAISAFDPALYEPRPPDDHGNVVGPPTGGFVQAGNVIPQYDLPNVPNVSKRVLTSIDPNNFAPRVGFAYLPRDSSPVVFRGGYGIFHSRASTLYVGGDTTMDFPPLYTIRRSPSGGVPLEDPFFPLPLANESPKFVVGVALAGNTFDRGLRTPYFQQYNLAVQYQSGRDLLLEVAYVGTRGLNLFRNVAINQAPLASPERPIINAVTGEVIKTNTPENAPLRAPYQGVEVGGFTQIQTTAQSSYNSLQMSLTKRLSRGVQLLAAYTYSRSIDNASGNIGGNSGDFSDIGGILGDQLDNRSNRGLSDFDRTHRFVLSYLWELPHPAFAAKSFRGRLFFSNWQVAGIITAMSGLPIDIFDGSSSPGSFYGLNGNPTSARPNWAPGQTLGSATSHIPAGYFFNPFTFARALVQAGENIPSANGRARADAVGTDIGNVGRNVLRGARQTNVDFSLIKRFTLNGSKDIELRAEFFNLFNHVNFANPISNFSAIPSNSIDSTGQIKTNADTGDFGRITATSNNPRLIQFSAKFNF